MELTNHKRRMLEAAGNELERQILSVLLQYHPIMSSVQKLKASQEIAELVITNVLLVPEVRAQRRTR
jgi:hypothetical protein